MNLFEQILALLVAKFQGTRKDGLEVLAQALSQTNETIEEAKAVVNKMTPEKVASFIKDWRKSADAEITKAKDTYKAGLEEKYTFVEKGKEEPGKQTPPAGEMTPEKIAEMVKAAVKEAKVFYRGFEKSKENMKTGTDKVEFGNVFADVLSKDGGSDKLGEFYQSAIEAITYDNPDVFYLSPNKMYLNIETTTRGNTTTYSVYTDNGKSSSYLIDDLST